MITFQSYIAEQKDRTAVFTFGRFNPPTTGHEKLIMKLAKEADSTRDMYVFGSNSQDPAKNPLTGKQKQKGHSEMDNTIPRRGTLEKNIRFIIFFFNTTSSIV